MWELALAMWLAGGVPQNALTITSGSLVVEMEAGTAWNISSLRYKGQPLILPSGGRGAAVFCEGQWHGGGMRENSEFISHIEVRRCEQFRQEGERAYASGDVVHIRKDSRLGPLSHCAETIFEKDFFVQKHSFEALENTNISVLYAFIYSLWPQAKLWLARPLRGNVKRGEFTADNANKPAGTVRWLAQYDPVWQTGALAYFPEAYGHESAFQCFWDREMYHKLLAQPQKGQLPRGWKWEGTLVMQFFQASPEQWEQKAQELAQSWQQRFPPQPGPEGPRYGEGVPEEGLLTLKTAHYTVPVAAQQAWTIYKIEYDGNVIAHERGFYGTVLQPAGGHWWGTGHTEGGREIVHSLKLLVDGQEQPVAVDKTITGRQLTLIKDSTIWKLKCQAEIEITDDYIRERTQLEALEAVELKLLYYFMHCFVPTTTQWAAELPDGTMETGELRGEGGFTVNKMTRWIAQYEPNWHYGLLCYTPRVLSGPGSATKIWDLDISRYHKLYHQACQNCSLQAGERIDYSVIVQVVPNETGDWTATKAAAEKLKKLFPPQ